MSRQPLPQRRASLPALARATTIASGTSLRGSGSNLQSKPELRTQRLASFSGGLSGSQSSTASNVIGTGNKPLKAVQRTTKTSQKLVVLPSEPQTAPFPPDHDETTADERPPPPKHVQEHYERRSEGERMTKSERQRAGYRRLTAYCVAEASRTKLLLAFLKREHAVVPRVFDEAVYAVSSFVFLRFKKPLVSSTLWFTHAGVSSPTPSRLRTQREHTIKPSSYLQYFHPDVGS